MKMQVNVIKEKAFVLLLDKAGWCWQSECDGTGNH